MMTTREPIPAGRYGAFTAPQLVRVRAAWDDICDRIPAEQIGRRLAALDTAVGYVMGRTGLDSVRTELAVAREQTVLALAAARQIALLAVADGMHEAVVADQLGVDRMSVRAWQGKR